MHVLVLPARATLSTHMYTWRWNHSEPAYSVLYKTTLPVYYIRDPQRNHTEFFHEPSTTPVYPFFLYSMPHLEANDELSSINGFRSLYYLSFFEMGGAITCRRNSTSQPSHEQVPLLKPCFVSVGQDDHSLAYSIS